MRRVSIRDVVVLINNLPKSFRFFYVAFNIWQNKICIVKTMLSYFVGQFSENSDHSEVVE